MDNAAMIEKAKQIVRNASLWVRFFMPRSRRKTDPETT